MHLTIQHHKYILASTTKRKQNGGNNKKHAKKEQRNLTYIYTITPDQILVTKYSKKQSKKKLTKGKQTNKQTKSSSVQIKGKQNAIYEKTEKKYQNKQSKQLFLCEIF